MLSGPTRARLDEVYSKDSETLAVFLREASEGASERFSRNGIIRPPALRQRRRAARLTLGTSCELVAKTGTYPAEIADVSKTGAGLKCSAPLAIGESVVVRLKDRRELEATVVRRNGDSFGLKLSPPLSETDQLFWSGAGPPRG